MLSIFVPETELYDEEQGCFITVKPIKLNLEHSLVSVSKWEMKWKKPFLDNKTSQTAEESRDYIRCMTMNQHVDPIVYYALTPEHFKKVNDYINESMTATWFNDKHSKPRTKEIITSELLYYQMIAFGIPFECQKWHLSRLLTLIRICSIKSSSDKKMSQRDVMANNRALNEARRKMHHTKG